MGLLATISAPIERLVSTLPLWQIVLLAFSTVLALAIIANVTRQWLFYDRSAPPEVFSLLPGLGSTIRYGIDPFNFFFDCQKKYGDVFTFILLGRKVTVCLGTKGNEFILNSKLKDVNAEEVYTGLTTPVFGTGECTSTLTTLTKLTQWQTWSTTVPMRSLWSRRSSSSSA
jgi:Cytochrome P450